MINALSFGMCRGVLVFNLGRVPVFGQYRTPADHRAPNRIESNRIGNIGAVRWFVCARFVFFFCFGLRERIVAIFGERQRHHWCSSVVKSSTVCVSNVSATSKWGAYKSNNHPSKSVEERFRLLINNPRIPTDTHTSFIGRWPAIIFSARKDTRVLYMAFIVQIKLMCVCSCDIRMHHGRCATWARIWIGISCVNNLRV